jgi:hypothetical protein
MRYQAYCYFCRPPPEADEAIIQLFIKLILLISYLVLINRDV